MRCVRTIDLYMAAAHMRRCDRTKRWMMDGLIQRRTESAEAFVFSVRLLREYAYGRSRSMHCASRLPVRDDLVEAWQCTMCKLHVDGATVCHAHSTVC